MAQQQSNEITLKGSTAIVTEFFAHSINSILYQRGIYPPESFDAENKFGLRMMVTNDKGLSEYLSTVLGQMSSWMIEGKLQQIVVVITGEEDGCSLERWVFNIETDKDIVSGAASHRTKPSKEVTREIQAIIRQITSSVTFLPLLDQPCSFDLLLYASHEVDVPRSWEETDPKYITNSEEVRLRSFTTKVHKVDAMVAYKRDMEPESDEEGGEMI